MSYLVCDRCEGYYELQPGESPEDFSDKCECGGHLSYVQDLEEADGLNEVCQGRGFELKKPIVTEKQVIFRILFTVPAICFFMICAIYGGSVPWAVLNQLVFEPDSVTNFFGYVELFIVMSIFAGCFLVAAVALSWRLYVNYLMEYRTDLRWVAIVIAFVVAIVIGSFGERYLGDLFVIGPLIGGFVAGCIVGKSYMDGLVNGGFPAGMAGFISIIILIFLFGGSNAGTSFEVILSGTLILAIPYFMAFFIVGSIGGMLGAGIRKKVSR
ncbi:DUF5518 domain-containing protein [Methanobacterium congolense]|uniref:Uncharacterized protein n=1 Tax=Methanobacterium congolense TaxID=118062 RepID=A0A1D3KZY1_9EURY|nr:DUF5518 domain-containing protein [Methanobacterium congolense]SCG84820.1 putative protein [Methanobacterium congolense]